VWYGGTIRAANANGTYAIDYDDGDTELTAKASRIKPEQETDSPAEEEQQLRAAKAEMAPIMPGQRVQARFRGDTAWYGGTVRAVNVKGGHVIDYDDGDCEEAVQRDLIKADIDLQALLFYTGVSLDAPRVRGFVAWDDEIGDYVSLSRMSKEEAEARALAADLPLVRSSVENPSGYRGVIYVPHSSNYPFKIFHRARHYCIGAFKSAEVASLAHGLHIGRERVLAGKEQYDAAQKSHCPLHLSRLGQCLNWRPQRASRWSVCLVRNQATWEYGSRSDSPSWGQGMAPNVVQREEIEESTLADSQALRRQRWRWHVHFVRLAAETRAARPGTCVYFRRVANKKSAVSGRAASDVGRWPKPQFVWVLGSAPLRRPDRRERSTSRPNSTAGTGSGSRATLPVRRQRRPRATEDSATAALSVAQLDQRHRRLVQHN